MQRAIQMEFIELMDLIEMIQTEQISRRYLDLFVYPLLGKYFFLNVTIKLCLYILPELFVS